MPAERRTWASLTSAEGAGDASAARRPRPRAPLSYPRGMARIGGRNTGIAWLAGVVCAGVIAGLVYLAAPMGPVMVTYFSGLLHR